MTVAFVSGLSTVMVVPLLAVLPLLGLARSPLPPSDALEMPRLMRRQAEDEARALGIQLSASGEFIQDVIRDTKERPPLDWCDLDFLYGTENKTECADSQYDHLIEEETMCGMAAWHHRASATKINELDKEHRPMGCFQAPCSYAARGVKTIQETPFEKGDKVTAQYKGSTDRYPADVTEKHADGTFAIQWEDGSKTDDLNKTKTDLAQVEEKCFFFNEFKAMPLGPVTGLPVCKREKFAAGKRNTGGGCKEGFSVIMDEDLCQEAAKCLAKCTDEDFEVIEFNESNYDEYPLGCFIHNKGRARRACAAFNPPNNTLFAALPKDPKGTPICNTTVLGR